MVQSSCQPGADPPASRLVVARVPSCYAVLTKGPAHLVERRAVAVVRPAVWSFVILDGLLRRLYGRAADRLPQREEVGVVPHGIGAGQPLLAASHPHRFGQPDRGSFLMLADVCVDPYALRLPREPMRRAAV